MIAVDVMMVDLVEIVSLVLLMVVDAMLVLMVVYLIELAAYGDILESGTVKMVDAVEVLVVVRMAVVEGSFLVLFGRLAFGLVVVLVEVWVLLGYFVFVNCFAIATIVVVAF